MKHGKKQKPTLAGINGSMKVDLHVHCKERSGCGKSWAEEQVVAAIAAGLDAIFFTDHDRLMPEQDLLRFNEKYAPFQIFGGVEVSVETEHVLVLGVNEPCMESTMWRYAELHQYVHERGGFTALAHPFRYRDNINIDIETFPPDAIEVASTNILDMLEERIQWLASYLSIPVLCNSDSHIRTTIGNHYNVTHHFVEDERKLIHILKSGEFQCCML